MYFNLWLTHIIFSVLINTQVKNDSLFYFQNFKRFLTCFTVKDVTYVGCQNDCDKDFVNIDQEARKSVAASYFKLSDTNGLKLAKGELKLYN